MTIISNPNLTLLRTPGHWTRLFLAIFKPSQIVTAQANQTFSTTDMVDEITYDTGNGDYTDIRENMTLLVGSSAGAADLGVARIRKAASATKIYISPISSARFADNVHLTVINDASIFARPVTVVSGSKRIDVDNSYTDQHEDCDPVPLMGPDAVAELTGLTVDVPFDAGDAWVFDSTITDYLWEAPGSAAIDDNTSATPIISYDAAGHYAVYCTVTAANGKTSTGMRRVIIHDANNTPVTRFELSQSPTCQYDTGGWGFSVRLWDEAAQADVRDRAFCILFAKDYFNGVEQSLGPVANRENIVCTGWIAGESINWDAEAGSVEFEVYGPQYWMRDTSAQYLTLNFATDTPTTWSDMPALTTDKAAWHLLHWRSNVDALVDFYPSNDTRYAPSFEISGSGLWDQLDQIGAKIYVDPGCNRYGQLFFEIEPQMVPEASRTWDTTMAVLSSDWAEKVNVSRKTKRRLAMYSTSGWKVGSGGETTTLYSLAMGHIHAQHGGTENADGLLVSSQTQSNDLAGLYVGWKNNEFDEISFVMPHNNRFIDCFPRSFLNITLDADDTPRGIPFSGNIIPRSVTLQHDPEAGTLFCELVTEAETSPELAVDGDVPASSGIDTWDAGTFPEPDFPEIQDLGDLGMSFAMPSATTEPNNQPRTVLITSNNKGLLYTTNFHETTPKWSFMNNGFDLLDQDYVLDIFATPSGALFAHTIQAGFHAIYAAAGLGSTWTKIAAQADFGGDIQCIAVDPRESEKIFFFAGPTTAKLPYYADRSGYSAVTGITWGASLNMADGFGGSAWFADKNYVCFFQQGIVAFPPAVVHVFSRDLKNFLGGNMTYNDGAGPGSSTRRPSALVGSGKFVWRWEDNAGVAAIWQYDATVVPDVDGSKTVYTTLAVSEHVRQGLAPSPTGNKLMGCRTSTGAAVYSSDGGATWSTSGTIPIGLDVWENCRDDFRWIAAGGTSIKLLMNFDDYTAGHNKEGNLPYVAPLIDITGVRFIA